MSFQNRNTAGEYEPIGEARSQSVEDPAQSEAMLKFYGYKHSKRTSTIYHALCLLFLGVPYAMFAWFPRFQVLKFKKTSLHTAEVIAITNSYGDVQFVRVHRERIDMPVVGGRIIQYFVYQHSKYVWDSQKNLFVALDDLLPGQTLSAIVKESLGLVDREQKELLKLYGSNSIEVKIKSYWTLFIEEVFNPFYVFQSFSVTLWCLDEYVIYAGCVFILTVFSIATSLIQTRRQSESLHKLIESSKADSVEIVRRYVMQDKAKDVVPPDKLVPGDLIVIPKTGCIMSCDAILLNGHCIVNESMLTGECVPITKTPPTASSEIYDPQKHRRHTLFAGTHVIQTRYYADEPVLARVTRTGFYTTKGCLIKSIMYPPPTGLKFYTDSLKFVFFLFVIAAGGMTYCLYLYIRRHADAREIVIRTLDIITIVVPPALPAAMTVGIVYSINRLKKLGIFCISPPRINVSGKLKLACFDKTGTLTNEGLDMACVLPSLAAQFTHTIENITSLDSRHPLLQAMATCHSLTRTNGVLNGDPLDLSMFESTKWILDEPATKETSNYDNLAPTVVKPSSEYYSNESLLIDIEGIGFPYEVGIIRQFPFSSQDQRMSVICRLLSAPQMVAFTKGAPERIRNMCLPETIPEDYMDRLTEYTARGFRVIAVAYKMLPMNLTWPKALKIELAAIECDLIFTGFIVLRNTLKPETTPVINALQKAHIRTVMITGDNLLTAISVARECRMVYPTDSICIIRTYFGSSTDIVPKFVIENIDAPGEVGLDSANFNDFTCHFAMDGTTWGHLRSFYAELLPVLVTHTTIFARFQPDQKTQLIRVLQDVDYIVSMVGDGANDCGALKAAHIGVSLSQAEASVAAPFTSSMENISCLLHLILEGRCALVTSFAVFKYMALYSLIQFFTILILYQHHSILGDKQFLFIDLIITTSLAVTIGRQGPPQPPAGSTQISAKIVPQRPMGSLINSANTFPLLLQVLTCAGVQLAALYYLTLQKWYMENPIRKSELIVCWQNTVLFTVSCFQYVIMAIVYSKGRPYREPLLRNFWLLISALLLTCFTTYLCIGPGRFAAEFFELIYLNPHHEFEQHIFRYKLMLFPIAHLLLAIFIETCVAERKWLKRIIHAIQRKTIPKNKYKSLRLLDLHRLLESAATK